MNQSIELLQLITILTGDNIKLPVTSTNQKQKLVTAQQTNLYELIVKVANDSGLQSIAKENRPFVSQSNKHIRPKQQQQHYLTWSGFQAIDIDFKCKEAAALAKPILHEMLTKYPWYVSTALSTSGNGLHIYTISKPLEIPTDIFGAYISNDMLHKAKNYYMDCYELKSYIIWKMLVMCYDMLVEKEVDTEICRQIHPVLNETTRRPNSNGEISNPMVIDAAMCKISQPLLITYDPKILTNPNVQLLEQAAFDVAIYASNDNKYRIDLLKNQFDRVRNRHDHANHGHLHSITNGEQTFDTQGDIQILQYGNMQTCTPQNYDNVQRYRMAYTLAWLYNLTDINTGQYQEVLDMFLLMCSGNPKFASEQKAWAKTFQSAVVRNKQGSAPCIWSAIKDLREHHGFKFQFKNRSSIVVNELIKEHNSEDAIKSFILAKLPGNDMFDLKYDKTIELASGEFLSTYKDELENTFVNGLNLLIARPGSGKTEFFKNLIKDGKRVLLVEPYTSILSSKLENSDLNVHCIYGNKSSDISKHTNAAMTFDKFTYADAEELSILYDYIVIDESHLLTISSYRDKVPADCIDKLSNLHTKVILMTGTPIAEHMFLKFDTITKCNKPLDFNKDVKFVCCQHDGDKLGKLSRHIANSIQNGKKILFPTNKGDMFVHSVMGAISMQLGYQPKFKYYKKDNSLHDFVQAINEKGTVGNIDVMFCTNYLSVGIDINDSCEFDVIYDETFSGPEIEQFNSRLRKISICSYVYFSMLNSKGEPRNITAYDDLDLSITKIESLTFWDMLQMQAKRNDARSMYDFFERAFQRPWFYKDMFTGEIKVHATAYKLAMFEDKWRKWAEQLNVIQNTLTGYGYDCSVIQDVAIEDTLIAKALNAAKEARSEYRLEKNSKIGRMFASFCNQSTFDLIMSIDHNSIIDSDQWKLVKKRKKQEFSYKVEDRKIFDDWRSTLKLLSKFYKLETIMTVVDKYVIDDKQLYRLARLHSLRDAVSIFDASMESQMDKSNINIMSYVVNTIFESKPDAMLIDNEQIDAIVGNCASLYFDAKGYQPQSPEVLSSVSHIARRLFNAITIKHDNIYAIKTLPPFDSGYSRTRNTMCNILSALFDNQSIFTDNVDRTNLQNGLQLDINRLVFDNEHPTATEHNVKIVSFKLINSSESNEIALSNIEEIDDAVNCKVYSMQADACIAQTQVEMPADAISIMLTEAARQML